MAQTNPWLWTCPHCAGQWLPYGKASAGAVLGSAGGQSRSPAKAEASRANGKRGGRPAGAARARALGLTGMVCAIRTVQLA